MANKNAVALKLPPFWISQPRVWFQQAEAQFALRKITADDTKYFNVVAALDQETASRLIDFLKNPPEEDRYGSIKKRLLSTFDLSQQERAARLLSFPELGDRKRTALMDDMLALLGSHQPCFLFNYIFLQRLPEDIRVALASEDINNPRQLAQKADILWLAKSREPNISRISKTPSQRSKQPKFVSDSEASTNSDKVGQCYYHKRFGNKALRCVSPCQFQGNALAGRR